MRKTREIEVKTGRYITLLGASRFFRMLFWIKMFIEGEHWLYLIMADLIHTCLLADFIYIFLKSKKTKGLIILN